MDNSGRSRHLPRFGIFELDLQAGELRKHGLRIRLQEQPFRVLAALLERPGEVVTREELRKRLWPDDTFVDFDHGLASAINRLREALGDSAENPRYVETLARRGYRFIAPVDTPPTEHPALVEAPSEQAHPTPAVGGMLKSRYAKVAAAGGLLIAAALVTLYLTSPLPPPRVLRIVELTAGGPSDDLGVLVTDGVRIYFSRAQAGRWSLAAIPVSGGEPTEISTPLQRPCLEDISPDGSEFLVTNRTGTYFEITDIPLGFPLYIVPVVGGSARRVGNVEVMGAGWMPHGREFVYAYGRGLFLANRDGSGTRQLVSTPHRTLGGRASPDGKLIRFDQWDTTTLTSSLWQVATDGTGLRLLLPGWNDRPDECCGQWSGDGRYFLFTSTRGGMTGTWAIRESVGFLRRARREPVRLTEGPIAMSAPLVSKDGREVFVSGTQERAEVVLYDATARNFVPYLGGKSISMLNFTRDGQWLCYVSYADGTLWKSKADTTERVQLTVPPTEACQPRWSPDGKLIAFMAKERQDNYKVHLISAEGGTPQLLTPGETANQEDLGWSSDGSLLVFAQGAKPGDPAGDLRLFDLRTRQVSKLPGSQGLFSPRWSPDGRYIAALTVKSWDAVVFDFKTRTWAELVKGRSGWQSWSRDGKHLYLLGMRDAKDWICRVRISDCRVEKLVSVKEIPRPPTLRGQWMGLAADDSPLVIRHVKFQEIYALKWEAP